jgi:glycosyltransferase involved in cell wall biosynthesis
MRVDTERPFGGCSPTPLVKLLVFAHTPPPHHGQSYMVKLMLDRLGGDARERTKTGLPPGEVECYHVNARYSETLEDIGSFRFAKAWLVVRYCMEAIWCRFRYNVPCFYYVPAPGKRAALYRDWIVMILCRPFFRDFIHHWHAVGLGDWLRSEGSWFERWLTHRLLGSASLGIALAIPSMRDALWFTTRRVELVANGIPDPCPDFVERIAAQRKMRVEMRRCFLARETISTEGQRTPGAASDAGVFKVLYLAHGLREKGVFDALEAISIAQRRSAEEKLGIRFHLTVAGEFPRDDERAEFEARIAKPDLIGLVEYAGFVSGESKTKLLEQSDCLCFPTYYHAESFGLVVVEAMAAGMTVVTTRWRAIPELLPSEYPGLVPIRSPQAVADALVRALDRDDSELLRNHFTLHFTEHQHAESLQRALLLTTTA